MKILILLSLLFCFESYGLEASCKYRNNRAFQVHLTSLGVSKIYDSYYDEILKSAGFNTEEIVRNSLYDCEAISELPLTVTCTFKNGKTRTVEMNSVKFGVRNVRKYGHNGYDFWEEADPYVSFPVSLQISPAVKNYSCSLEL